MSVTETQKFQQILQLAFEYGATDGDHHKQYALDQILRIILENEYQEWLRKQCVDEDGEECIDWSVGIP